MAYCTITTLFRFLKPGHLEDSFWWRATWQSQACPIGLYFYMIDEIWWLLLEIEICFEDSRVILSSPWVIFVHKFTLHKKLSFLRFGGLYTNKRVSGPQWWIISVVAVSSCYTWHVFFVVSKNVRLADTAFKNHRESYPALRDTSTKWKFTEKTRRWAPVRSEWACSFDDSFPSKVAFLTWAFAGVLLVTDQQEAPGWGSWDLLATCGMQNAGLS